VTFNPFIIRDQEHFTHKKSQFNNNNDNKPQNKSNAERLKTKNGDRLIIDQSDLVFEI